MENYLLLNPWQQKPIFRY